ncbi:hypothetical protein KTC96_06615 [Clostridium estertheticum]|nr:hypothetical protein [Clostridium estertheticum]WLC72555.1 hypothetical protein KTC96_06615 [Clostridium estertheticum]
MHRYRDAIVYKNNKTGVYNNYYKGNT